MPKESPNNEAEEHSPHPSVRESLNLMSVAQIGLFTLAAGYTVYLIRPVLLPVILALLLTLILKPIQRRIIKYLRFPEPLAALFVMLAAAALAVIAIMSLSQPVLKYAEEIRGEKVKERFAKLTAPFVKVKAEITEVAEEVQKIADVEPSPAGKTVTDGDVSVTEGGESLNPDDVDISIENKSASDPQKKSALKVDVTSDSGELSVESSAGGVDVESKADDPAEQPVKVQITNTEDPVKPLYTFASKFSVDFFATLGMLFFFLAYGEIMITRMAEVDSAAKLLEELTHDVSYYLFSISLINLCLGTSIGVAMWLLGMPNPLLWGVMAALLNYIPYLGAIAGTLIVLVVATITFEHTRQVIPVPIAYYLLTTIEGNFVTPAVIGRKFTLNPIIVFAWVFCWGTMWGVPGMLIGLPLLMVFRIICAKLPSLSRLERVISI